MAAGTYPAIVIPELTDSQIKDMFVNMDMAINNAISCALLYGKRIYCYAMNFSNQCLKGYTPG